MYTSIFLFSFISFWCFYHISKNSKHQKGALASILSDNISIAKSISGLLFMLSVILLSYMEGLVSGILVGLFLWIMSACLIVFIAPFNIVKLKHFLPIVIGSVIIEFFIS